ncbi:DEAD/DEAH box helicase [Methylobacterium sp. NEAU K]|uniref:DEAD/DEAH box helicase n=1 Tax=Methylobacterium sp. NEAU K TaxID=3064946 RepID=UPI002734607F|nr:DEAD/DEAH box helicase [Methylobacterium sp. NEAU K]MDP4003290.1 hypothetical protein [Methylobacterium sp. NEAU K]
MQNILTSEAPIGSGKTRTIAKTVIREIDDGATFIVIQPTREVISQTAAQVRLLDPNINIEIINSDTWPGKVVYRLSEHLKQPLDRPHLILTTASAFENLPFLVKPERYHLVCDEIPKGFKSHSEQIPCNHNRLTDAITVDPQGSSYGEIHVRDRSTLRTIAENRRGDAIDAILQPFARSILNKNYRTFVNLEQYEALRRGDVDEPFLRMFSLLRPETFAGFQTVRMLGARAHETLLFRWFKRCGVRFEDDEEILSQLRYREHTNGDLIDFYYGSETNWSLYAQEQDQNIRDVITNAAIELLSGKSFCWLDNKDFEDDSPFGSVAGTHKLPHASHGRNDFQHHDNVVVLTAFNPNPHDARFFEDFTGISWNEQKIAHDYHNTYQTIGRISIRDPNNSNRKIVVLPDRQNAEWQSRLFPGSRVHSLNVDYRTKNKPGPKQKHANANERKRASREKLQHEQEQLVEKYDLGSQRILEAGYHMSCHEISYSYIRENVTTYQGSIVNNKFEGMSFPLTMNNEDFGKYLNGLHRMSIAGKDSNNLIMPALCVPVQEIDTQRAEENALYGRHVYLDIENGKLTHLKLSRIFPNQEMIVYSSYNHTPDLPRYRVVFLTDDVMRPTVYKFLWHQIVQRIENSGFYDAKSNRPKGERKLHGIDNKPNIVNAFYLPCQPKEGKGFYYHYIKNRKPLNVQTWIENAIPTRFDVDTGPGAITVNEVAAQLRDHNQIIDAAMNRYRQVINSYNIETGKLGGSNDALFVLDQTLKRANVDLWEREITLTQAANESRSPQDRLRDKDRYMKRR